MHRANRYVIINKILKPEAKMKIYFSGSIYGGRQKLETYKKIN